MFYSKRDYEGKDINGDTKIEYIILDEDGKKRKMKLLYHKDTGHYEVDPSLMPGHIYRNSENEAIRYSMKEYFGCSSYKVIDSKFDD